MIIQLSIINMKATKQQIAAIHKHLPPDTRTDKEFKESLVAQFSGEGHTSTKELTQDEADMMIAKLSGSYEHYALFDKNRKQHKFLLALAYQAKDKDGNSPYLKWSEQHKRLIPCLSRLGHWIATRSKYKRPLSRLDQWETGVVIEQFKKVVEYGYEKV